jgi:hypothetical protein
MRVMATGPHANQSAMYLDAPSALALPYTRYFRKESLSPISVVKNGYFLDLVQDNPTAPFA